MPMVHFRDFEERLAWEWAVRCFGQAHCENRGVRSIRFFEEACELMQAFNISEEMCEKVLRTVYSRPVGAPLQEVGGVEMTLSVLCTGIGVSRHVAFQSELSRCLAKSPEHFAKRNAEKEALGLKSIEPTSTGNKRYPREEDDENNEEGA